MGLLASAAVSRNPVGWVCHTCLLGNRIGNRPRKEALAHFVCSKRVQDHQSHVVEFGATVQRALKYQAVLLKSPMHGDNSYAASIPASPLPRVLAH